jgi:hypothetical protein
MKKAKLQTGLGPDEELGIAVHGVGDVSVAGEGS